MDAREWEISSWQVLLLFFKVEWQEKVGIRLWSDKDTIATGAGGGTSQEGFVHCQEAKG